MIQRDLGDGTYASYDETSEPVLPPPGANLHDKAYPRYPGVVVHLSTGHDGNIGAIMDSVRQALRRKLSAAEAEQIADQMWAQIFEAESYDESLRIVMQWVTVT